jgi:hypothetical protein
VAKSISFEDWVKSLAQDVYDRFRAEVEDLLDDEDPALVSAYLEDGGYFLSFAIENFYVTYNPRYYIRKDDLSETIEREYATGNIVLNADNLEEFKSHGDKHMIFDMIKNGIRYYLPWTKKLEKYQIETYVSPNTRYKELGEIEYKGTLGGAYEYWDNEVAEMYLNLATNRIIAKITEEIIPRYI